MENIYNKINKIFSYYFDEKNLNDLGIDKKNTPSVWNVDTDFIKTLERMNTNLENINDDIVNIKVFKTDQNRYEMIINNKIVTPVHLKKNIINPVAFSTMRQYLQLFLWLNIITFDEFKKGNNYQVFRAASNFKSVIYEFVKSNESTIESVKQMIAYSIKRNVTSVRNLGYTFFLAFLNQQKIDFSKIEDTYKVVTKKMNKDGIKCFALGDKDFIDYFKHIEEATTKSLVSIFNKYELNEFINDLLNKMDSKNMFYSDDVEEQIKRFNLESELKIERSRLKPNIIKNRIELNLIKTENDIYSDVIELESELMDGLSAKINELNACHIKEHKTIKNELSDKARYEELIHIMKETSDPYNGILMDLRYHKYFDRYLFNFDINGEMIWSKKDEKYLFEDLKFKKIKINPLLLENGKMKEYLKKRGILNASS